MLNKKTWLIIIFKWNNPIINSNYNCNNNNKVLVMKIVNL